MDHFPIKISRKSSSGSLRTSASIIVAMISYGCLMLRQLNLCNAMSLPRARTYHAQPYSDQLSPSQLNSIIQSPHIGYFSDKNQDINNNKTFECFVIGTSHLRCNSAKEVASLIEQVRPDGVVLELDPERVLRLTKQQSSLSSSDVVNSMADDSDLNHKESMETCGRSINTEELLYGADFVSAIETCQRLDIPLFLGDEYAQETKRRLMQQLLNIRAYSPIPLVLSLLGSNSTTSGHDSTTAGEIPQLSRINLVNSFVNDPKKLTPLIVTSSPSILIAIAFAFFNHDVMGLDEAVGGALYNTLQTILTAAISFFASCLLFNTVIVERDEILAASTLRALKVIRSLKGKKSIRKSWKFTVDETGQIDPQNLSHKQKLQPQASSSNAYKDKNKEKSMYMPLFTLKTPLKEGMIRNLNLFEPRWLKMIDKLTSPNNFSNSSPSRNDIQDPPQFGCVCCTNKFYSAISINGAEGRYADVIFERSGTLANLMKLQEGKRPVSGDRKVAVTIQGGESFVVDESNISVSDDGYMVASKIGQASVSQESWSCGDAHEEERVKIVVVVGLLHGNGVVELLSKNTSNS